MLNLKSACLFLVCLGVISCTETIPEQNDGPEAGTTRTSSVTFAAEGSDDLSVYVFSKTDDSFLFSSLLNEGWVERDGKKLLFKEMVEGDYKFLFLANRCENLTLPEIPVTRSGELFFEDMIISHKKLSPKEGCFSGADEIYMQDKVELAAMAHTISGNKVIEANLTRAVGKVDVLLGRGYITTDQGGQETIVPVPYTGGEKIADLYREYEIEVIDCGDHLAIHGCNGKASVYENYATGHDAIRTILPSDEDNVDGLKTGFAVLSGPFILPPSDNSDMQVRVKLIPTEESGLPVFEKVLVNGRDGDLNISRNHKLTISFWLEDKPSPAITVRANVTDMNDETTGDSGMWY